MTVILEYVFRNGNGYRHRTNRAAGMIVQAASDWSV